MRPSPFLYLMIVVMGALLFVNVEDRTGLYVFSNLIQLVALGFAGFNFLHIAATRAARSEFRVACSYFALGTLIWIFGQMMVAYSEVLLHKSPFGTVSSYFFLFGSIFYVAAVVVLIRKYVSWAAPSATGYIVHALILFVLLMSVDLFLLRHEIFDADFSLFRRLLGLTYSIVDLGIVAASTVLIRVARSSGHPHEWKAYALIGAAFLIFASGDIGMSGVDFGTALYRGSSLIYFTSYCLLSWCGSVMEKVSLP